MAEASQNKTWAANVTLLGCGKLLSRELKSRKQNSYIQVRIEICIALRCTLVQLY